MKFHERMRQYKATLQTSRWRISILLFILDVLTLMLAIVLTFLGTYQVLGNVLTVSQVAFASLLVKDHLSAKKAKNPTSITENDEPNKTKPWRMAILLFENGEPKEHAPKMRQEGESPFRVVGKVLQFVKEAVVLRRQRSPAAILEVTNLAEPTDLDTTKFDNDAKALPRDVENGEKKEAPWGFPEFDAKVLLIIISFLRLVGTAEAQDFNTELTEDHENIWKPIRVLVFCLCLSWVLYVLRERLSASVQSAGLPIKPGFLKSLYVVLPILVLLAQLFIFTPPPRECPTTQFDSTLPMLNPLFPSRVALKAVTGTWLTYSTIPYNREYVVVLPDADELAEMHSHDRDIRNNFFRINMAFTIGVTLLLAMLAWRFGRSLGSFCQPPVSESEAALLTAQTARDKDEVLPPRVYHTLFVSWYVLARLTIYAVVDACLRYGLLSDNFGLDWEAYLFLLQLLMLTQLVLSFSVFCSKHKRTHAMPASSILFTCLPFLGTEVHIVADNIVLALALRNSQCSNGGLAFVGYVISYTGVVYFFLHVPIYFCNATTYAALRASHWGIAEAEPPSSAGRGDTDADPIPPIGRGPALIRNLTDMLISATTSDKETHALWSELPMGAFKILTALFFGDSPFVFFTLVLAILKVALMKSARACIIPFMLWEWGASSNKLHMYYKSTGFRDIDLHDGSLSYGIILAVFWKQWELLATMKADAERTGQALVLGYAIGDRYELKLEGAGFGDADVAALARILPGTVVHVLIFRPFGGRGAKAHNFGDVGAKALAKALPHTSLQKLVLDQTNIGDEGVEALEQVCERVWVQEAGSMVCYLSAGEECGL